MTEPHAAMIMQLDSNARRLSVRTKEVVFGLSVGASGGAIQGIILGRSLAQSTLCGLLFGAAFGFLFAKRATSAGAGLIWALAFAVLLWIVFPAGILSLFVLGSHSMLLDARQRFPELVAFL